jgi:hypothetical protein
MWFAKGGSTKAKSNRPGESQAGLRRRELMVSRVVEAVGYMWRYLRAS